MYATLIVFGLFGHPRICKLEVPLRFRWEDGTPTQLLELLFKAGQNEPGLTAEILAKDFTLVSWEVGPSMSVGDMIVLSTSTGAARKFVVTGNGFKEVTL